MSKGRRLKSSSQSSDPSSSSALSSSLSSSAPPAGLCNEISQHGITWTFDQPYPCGRFVNGDWWVVGPVNIQAISPAPETIFKASDKLCDPANTRPDFYDDFNSDCLEYTAYCGGDNVCHYRRVNGAEFYPPDIAPRMAADYKDMNNSACTPADLSKCKANYRPVYTNTCVNNRCVYQRGRHGSMINPYPAEPHTTVLPRGGNSIQSYDSLCWKYDPGLLRRPPLSLYPGQSLVSTISLESRSQGTYTDLIGYAGSMSALDTAAVLSALETAPPADSFRPPYAGDGKPIYRAAQLHPEYLPALAPPAGAVPPRVSDSERYFERVWLDHMVLWPGRDLHPINNMPNYGREIATTVGNAGLLLSLNYSVEQKRKLLIEVVQTGIDMYGLSRLHKGIWEHGGGHGLGRKWLIAFAARMLEQNWNTTDFLNSEDSNTYYGDAAHQLWTGWQNSGHPYAKNVMWGMWHDLSKCVGGACTGVSGCSCNFADHEHVDPINWNDLPFPIGGQYAFDKFEPYKRLCSRTLPAQALSARLLGMHAVWGHDAFFDYTDRWMYEDDAANQQIMIAAARVENWPAGQDAYSQAQTGHSSFVNAMWHRYRAYAGGEPEARATAAPEVGFAPLTVTFDASGSSDSDGAIVSYDWNFGDGKGASGINAINTFEQVGEYKVSLTVRDNEGKTGTASLTIMAGDPNHLFEDFDGAIPHSPSGIIFDTILGNAPSVANIGGSGVLKLNSPTTNQTLNLIVVKAGSSGFTDYVLSAKVGHYYTSAGGVVLGFADSLNYYRLNLRSGKLERIAGGVMTELAGQGQDLTLPWNPSGEVHEYTIAASLNGAVNFQVVKDGIYARTFVDANPVSLGGNVGFYNLTDSPFHYFFVDDVDLVLPPGK